MTQKTTNGFNAPFQERLEEDKRRQLRQRLEQDRQKLSFITPGTVPPVPADTQKPESDAPQVPTSREDEEEEERTKDGEREGEEKRMETKAKEVETEEVTIVETEEVEAASEENSVVVQLSSHEQNVVDADEA